jgi:hypothetical protein
VGQLSQWWLVTGRTTGGWFQTGAWLRPNPDHRGESYFHGDATAGKRNILVPTLRMSGTSSPLPHTSSWCNIRVQKQLYLYSIRLKSKHVSSPYNASWIVNSLSRLAQPWRAWPVTERCQVRVVAHFSPAFPVHLYDHPLSRPKKTQTKDMSVHYLRKIRFANCDVHPVWSTSGGDKLPKFYPVDWWRKMTRVVRLCM